jgi:hypothetical protein
VHVSVVAVYHALSGLLLALAPPPKDLMVALVIRVYRLDQHINRRKEVRQHRTASGAPKSIDKLLVAPDHEHSW